MLQSASNISIGYVVLIFWCTSALRMSKHPCCASCAAVTTRNTCALPDLRLPFHLLQKLAAFLSHVCTARQR